MALCNNQCSRHERGSKLIVYHENGSFCSICDYYFKEWFLRCPCCNMQVRHGPKLSLHKINMVS